MKIHYWKQNNHFLNKQNVSSTTVLVGVIKHIDTNVVTGLYFRWTYFLESYDNKILHCIGSESFETLDFSTENFRLLFSTSLENFKCAFWEKLDLKDLNIQGPSYDISENELINRLKSLNELRERY